MRDFNIIPLKRIFSNEALKCHSCLKHDLVGYFWLPAVAEKLMEPLLTRFTQSALAFPSAEFYGQDCATGKEDEYLTDMCCA